MGKKTFIFLTAGAIIFGLALGAWLGVRSRNHSRTPLPASSVSADPISSFTSRQQQFQAAKQALIEAVEQEPAIPERYQKPFRQR